MNKREVWLDYIKIFACILVFTGHLLQSMVASNILESNLFLKWFDKTIYYFHVPLFFICSGYLYQKLSKINNCKSYLENILKKAINLGIPFLVFTIITWCFQNIFSNSVNSESRPLYVALFINPISVYWYLYCLFFIFLITPTMNNHIMTIIISVIAILFKIITFTNFNIDLYFMNVIMSNLIWFVMGMLLTNIKILNYNKNIRLYVGIITLLFFIILSILLLNINCSALSFILGLIACISFISLFSLINNNILLNKLSKYTMPVFLMHTIFAAGIRAVMLKLGIVSPFIHITIGLIISFVGPMITFYIMEKIKYLDFVVFPNKYISFKINKKEAE